MRELPVHWHEGMFLRPHHFQASDRHWGDQLRQVSRWDHPYNWGVRKCDIDLEALRAGRFVVRSLQARLRDGTVIRVPQDTHLKELQVGAVIREQETAEVHLAVPSLEVGRPNVGGNDLADVRYRVETPRDGVPDENNGVNPRPIQFRRLNLTLLLAGQDTAGFETMPLAKIRRSAGSESFPELEPEFVPPLLSCDGWLPLKQDILTSVYNQLTPLVRRVSADMVDRRVTLRDTDPDAREIVENLRMLNEAISVARVLARTEHLHPYPAYLELCRMIGQLAIYDDASPGCPELIDYNHDELGETFFTLKRILDKLIRCVVKDGGVFKKNFRGEGLMMTVEMNPEWLADKWSFYIGVQSNLPQATVIA
ncbi:MAG: type VI secretion system baseplate subunit TssK, partial [Gemmataceae bacterium]